MRRLRLDRGRDLGSAPKVFESVEADLLALHDRIDQLESALMANLVVTFTAKSGSSLGLSPSQVVALEEKGASETIVYTRDGGSYSVAEAYLDVKAKLEAAAVGGT